MTTKAKLIISLIVAGILLVAINIVATKEVTDDKQPVKAYRDTVPYEVRVTPVTPTPVPTPTFKSELPKYFVTSFMDECNADGTNKVFCECTLTSMEKKLGASRLLDVAIKYHLDQEIPPVMVEALDECLDNV